MAPTDIQSCVEQKKARFLTLLMTPSTVLIESKFSSPNSSTLADSLFFRPPEQFHSVVI
jgi:hypothetical protein